MVSTSLSCDRLVENEVDRLLDRDNLASQQASVYCHQ